MKRLVPLFLSLCFIFSSFFVFSVAASDSISYWDITPTDSRSWIANAGETVTFSYTAPENIYNLVQRIVVVGYFRRCNVDNFDLLLWDQESGLCVYTMDVNSHGSYPGTFSITSTDAEATYQIYYAYLELSNSNVSITSGTYYDGLMHTSSFLPSPHDPQTEVTFPNYWTQFENLEIVIPASSLSGASAVTFTFRLDNIMSSVVSGTEELIDFMAFSGGELADYTISVSETVDDLGHDLVGSVTITGQFNSDLICRFFLHVDDTSAFTFRIDEVNASYNLSLSESQILTDINKTLGTGFSSMEELLSSLGSKVDTSNSWLSQIWQTITSGFQAVGNWFSTTWSNLSSGFSNVVSSIVTWGQNIVTSVTTWGDNIVNALWDLLGPADPEPPPGSDVVGDLGSLEEGLFGDTESGRNDFNNIVGNAGALVSGLGAAFGASSVLISYFLNIPFVNTLLTISLSLFSFFCILRLFI